MRNTLHQMSLSCSQIKVGLIYSHFNEVLILSQFCLQLVIRINVNSDVGVKTMVQQNVRLTGTRAVSYLLYPPGNKSNRQLWVKKM